MNSFQYYLLLQLEITKEVRESALSLSVSSHTIHWNVLFHDGNVGNMIL